MIGSIKRLPSLNLIKVLVGLALLMISLLGVDWYRLKSSLVHVNFFWLLAVMGTIIFGLFLKIIRSFVLLRNFDVKISFSRTAEAFFLGQAVNFLFPSRGGDLLRLGYMSAEQASLLPRVMAAVMLEKLLDLIAITIVALGVSSFLPAERAFWVQSWLLPLSILGVIGLVILILWGPKIWSKFRGRISPDTRPWINKLLALGDQLVQSSLWLRSPQRMTVFVFFTLLIWGVMWGTNMALFRGLSLRVPWVAGGLILILGYIGVLPNLMPGNIGPFYFFVQLGMAPFGISQEIGLAYTVLLHAIVTGTPLIASGVSMLMSESVRNSLVALWKSR